MRKKTEIGVKHPQAKDASTASSLQSWETGVSRLQRERDPADTLI